MNGNGGQLSSLLKRLHEDEALQEAYVKDPEGTLRQAGVSDDTIHSVLSRDLKKIKNVLDKELPGVQNMCFMVVISPEL